eukprot:1228951-Prymnesium_polylepis.1
MVSAVRARNVICELRRSFAAGMGDAPADDAAEATAVAAAPGVPFDDATMDLVIDFRAACSLPFDPDNDGVHALRAVVFQKGKGIHHPHEPGKLVVAGKHSKQAALSIVHFAPSTKRQPELLLYFVDYGFANGAMSGISVETLGLPLLVRKSVYSDAAKLTRLRDVVGFTEINSAQTPWSVHLKPALKKQPLFASLGIYSPKDVNTWLKSQTMDARVEELFERARASMATEIASLVRQDKVTGEKQRAVFEGKLAMLESSIAALPPKAYDLPLGKRILELKEGSENNLDRSQLPDWLQSPVHRAMAE